MPPRARGRRGGRGQVRGADNGHADDHAGPAPQLRGQDQVVGGLQPAVIDCSESSDEDSNVQSRKKPSLVAEGPRYGYKLASGTFISKSNFILKVKSEIESEKYTNLKGHTYTLKLAPSARYPSGSVQEIFIPKCYVKDAKIVEGIIDRQVRGTIDMDFDKNEWKMLVRKLIDQFDSDSVGYCAKKFVEMTGIQVHSLRESGQLYFVFGPNCSFKNLEPDSDPVHYWYSNLSLNAKESAKLSPVMIIPDETLMDDLLQHATPGQELTYFFCLGAALSCNAGPVIRWRGYEHFQACFFGSVGAGKTKAAEACLKLVGGSKQSKTDHQTKSQTIKKGMSYQTIPLVIDDMKSSSQAGNLVVSNYDDNTYETSDGEYESYCETILTTNYIWDLRTVSRMVVLEFVKISVPRTHAEKEEADHSFRRMMQKPGTPIVTAMAYCHYVQSPEWLEDFRHFRTVVEETHDLIDREAINYAQLLTAVRWLFTRKQATFEQLGYSWEDLLDHFKIGMAGSIASFHVSMTVPESVIRAYIKLIRLLTKSWPLYERKRSLAFISCSEKKIATRRALAIRQSEKRFKELGHIKMDLVKKTVVVRSIGGLVDLDCTAFLSQHSEDDEVELGINSQRHLAIVLPLTALKSRDLTDLSTLLSVDPPSGVDLELPSGLTTMFSVSDESMTEARNSTAISDPSGYFDGEEIEEVSLTELGLLCKCGRLFSNDSGLTRHKGGRLVDCQAETVPTPTFACLCGKFLMYKGIPTHRNKCSQQLRKINLEQPASSNATFTANGPSPLRSQPRDLPTLSDSSGPPPVSELSDQGSQSRDQATLSAFSGASPVSVLSDQRGHSRFSASSDPSPVSVLSDQSSSQRGGSQIGIRSRLRSARSGADIAPALPAMSQDSLTGEADSVPPSKTLDSLSAPTSDCPASSSASLDPNACQFGCGRVIKNAGARKNHEKKCCKLIDQSSQHNFSSLQAQHNSTQPQQNSSQTHKLSAQAQQHSMEDSEEHVNSSLPGTSKVKCPTCGQECAPGRGLTLHMNWHRRNTTVEVQVDTASRCRICGKISKSPSSLKLCELSHRKK